MDYTAISITMSPDGSAYVRVFGKVGREHFEQFSKKIESIEELRSWQLSQQDLFIEGQSLDGETRTYER
jgi:hypothetical protein